MRDTACHLSPAISRKPWCRERLAENEPADEQPILAGHKSRALTTEERPTHADAHANLGLLRSGRGDTEGAEQSFAAAIRALPGHAKVLTSLGELQAARGEDAAAEASFAQAVQAA